MVHLTHNKLGEFLPVPITNKRLVRVAVDDAEVSLVGIHFDERVFVWQLA